MSMTVVWFLIVVAAAIAAFFVGRYTAPGSTRVRELEEQRDESSRELRFYREQVNSHFQTTAQLFNDVTASYRSLYEHLADGSEKLGRGPDSPLLSTPPEQRQLDEQLAATETPSEADDAGAAEQDEAKQQPERTAVDEEGAARTEAEGERWSLHDMKPRAEEQGGTENAAGAEDESRK